MERFWIVWNEQGGNPTYKHTSEASAKTEAVRLARNSPGQVFHALELIASVQKTDLVWLYGDDGIPF